MPIKTVTPSAPPDQPPVVDVAAQLRRGVTSPAIRTAAGDVFGIYEELANRHSLLVPTVLQAAFEQLRQAVRLAMPQLMTVRVRDRAAESPWGSGFTSPVVRTVTIPAVCPACGGPRGEVRNLNQCEDGAFYSVDVWENPCGHTDSYDAVVREASRYAELVDVDALGGGR